MVAFLPFISKKNCGIAISERQVAFSVTDDTDTIQQLDEEDDAA